MGEDLETELSIALALWQTTRLDAVGSCQSSRRSDLIVDFTGKDTAEVKLGRLKWFLRLLPSSADGFTMVDVGGFTMVDVGGFTMVNVGIFRPDSDRIVAVPTEMFDATVRDFLGTLLIPSYVAKSRGTPCIRCAEILDNTSLVLAPWAVELIERLKACTKIEMGALFDAMHSFDLHFWNHRKNLLDAGILHTVSEYWNYVGMGNCRHPFIGILEAEVITASRACDCARDARAEAARTAAAVLIGAYVTSEKEGLTAVDQEGLGCSGEMYSECLELLQRDLARKRSGPKLTPRMQIQSSKRITHAGAKSKKKSLKDPNEYSSEKSHWSSERMANYCLTESRESMLQQVLDGDVLQWCSLHLNKEASLVHCELQLGSFIQDKLTTATVGLSPDLPLKIDIKFGPDQTIDDSWFKGTIIEVHASQRVKLPNSPQLELGLSSLLPHLVRKFFEDAKKSPPKTKSWNSAQSFNDNLFVGLLRFLVRSLAQLPSICPICCSEHSHQISSLPHTCERNLCRALFANWTDVGPPFDSVLKEVTKIDPNPFPNQWDFEVARLEFELKAKYPDCSNLRELIVAVERKGVASVLQMDYEQLIHTLALLELTKNWQDPTEME